MVQRWTVFSTRGRKPRMIVRARSSRARRDFVPSVSGVIHRSAGWKESTLTFYSLRGIAILHVSWVRLYNAAATPPPPPVHPRHPEKLSSCTAHASREILHDREGRAELQLCSSGDEASTTNSPRRLNAPESLGVRVLRNDVIPFSWQSGTLTSERFPYRQRA